MLSRFFVFLPLVLSLVAFILTTLCLFAGKDEGFMEDFAIARVRQSALRYFLVLTKFPGKYINARAQHPRYLQRFLQRLR